METNLRQSETKVEVEGILSSKKLEISSDDKGNKVIKGNIVVKVDDTNSISFGVFVSEKTSKGEPSKAWAGMNTIMNEYKSIADVGEAEADRVHVNGGFNTFKTAQGQDVTNYKGSFFTRLTRPLDPKRKFSSEVFIKSKIWERDNNGEETGRLRVRGIAPDYAGINILDMVCPEKDENGDAFATVADDLFEVGNTYLVNGEIVNSRVEKKITAALGKVEGKTEFKNELVITGSTSAYEEEKAYSAEAINLAIQEYETAQNNKQNEKENPYTNKKPSAAASGRSLNF